jgi:S1-C subfamily serine protease
MRHLSQFALAPALVLFAVTIGGCAHATKTAKPAAVVQTPSRFEQNRSATVQIRQVAQSGLGLGTGVVVDVRGLVITNHHVISPIIDKKTKKVIPSEIKVCEVVQGIADCLAAEVVASDPKYDLALLRVRKTYRYAVRFGDETTLGEWAPVYTRANVGPLLPPSLMRGNYVGRAEAPYVPLLWPYLVIAIGINPGASGGPVFSEADDTLVGINQAITTFGGASMGLAVPVSLVKGFIAEHDPFLKETKKP